MRSTTNAEQPSPTRHPSRRRKTNEHLSGYVVGMDGNGRRGKDYTACKNLMKSFNECEQGNIAHVSGDNAAQNAARDRTVDSNATVNSIDEQGQYQDQDQDQAVREELKRFLNDNDDGLHGLGFSSLGSGALRKLKTFDLIPKFMPVPIF
ncbi:unnamed protein product [Bathycoccus prasinos]